MRTTSSMRANNSCICVITDAAQGYYAQKNAHHKMMSRSLSEALFTDSDWEESVRTSTKWHRR
jgi:hypothetical protein